MNSLLDTCVLSEYQKPKPNGNVILWLENQLEESLFLSILTVGEISKAIVKLPDSKRRSELLEWLNGLIYRFEKRILPIDLKTIEIWAALTGKLEIQGRVLPIVESLIVATALTHNLTVITRNENDFADTNVKLLNIWL